jgi:aspartyl-tRNA(Asn)/glutamyl-tRNA(Gln) amidotransferase subunit A
VAAVERALALAERHGELGAFWSFDRQGSREAAVLVEARLRGGEAVPLAGTPVAVKDLFDVAGLPTTAGLRGEHPPARTDAEAVRRLRRAGAIPIGKTAMDPLACTTGGQAPGFPPCLNPVDAALSPGGSSSGSAVAVAAGVIPIALGTDTAGSVRVPAAYCGVVGFKPGRRSIPRRGLVSVMPRFDTPGVLARSIEDCWNAFKALSGRNAQAGPGTTDEDAQRRRPLVGALVDLIGDGEGGVAEACEAALARLDPDRFEIEQVELGWRAPGLGIALAWELARVWGDRVDANPARFTDPIRSTIEFGRECGEERYLSAVAGLERAAVRLRRRFRRFSALVCPTVPVPAPDRDRETTFTSTQFTRIFSALGWPAVSLPAGRGREGRPVAVQVTAPPSRLGDVIAVARALEAGVVEPGDAS